MASSIVLIDINKDKAEGEVLDISQGTCFRDPISVVAGEYADAKDSDIVIITSGVPRKPGQTRIELTQTNINILKSITPEIVKAAPNALYIIVSNPADILTYAFLKMSGLPENQVIGSGTLLDTARLKYALSEHFNVAQGNIHAYVFGEHGDSSFVPWSIANISGASLDEYADTMRKYGKEIGELDKDATEDYIHKSGGKIIADKGATFSAIAVSLCRLCKILLSAHDSIAMVATMLHGEYGIDDVCLSVPTMIGPNGASGKLPVILTDEEIVKLQASANKLKDVIRQINFD
jgi:L-lactate dehydrogenase